MRISEERITRYKELAGRGISELFHADLAALFARAEEQGAELMNVGFSGLGFFRAPLSKDLSTMDIACVGVPLDSGAPWRSGGRLGPMAVREWSQKLLQLHNPATGVTPLEFVRLGDYGDLDLPLAHTAALEQIAETWAAFRNAAVVPFGIGGEHTINYAMVKGLVELDAPVGLIFVDAHTDTAPVNPEFLDGGDVTDGNLVTWSVIEGRVDPERTIQIGLRGGGLGVAGRMSEDLGMRVVPIEEFEQMGVQGVIEETRRVVGDGPTYLSFDTDAIGSSYMQGTQLAEPFGITDREARTYVRGLRGLNLVGADLVEVTPAHDITGASSNLAAALAFEILCVLAETTSERNGERRPTNWV